CGGKCGATPESGKSGAECHIEGTINHRRSYNRSAHRRVLFGTRASGNQSWRGYRTITRSCYAAVFSQRHCKNTQNRDDLNTRILQSVISGEPATSENRKRRATSDAATAVRSGGTVFGPRRRGFF